MIFYGNWVPQSENEYQMRLLAMCIMLVMCSGAEVRKAPNLGDASVQMIRDVLALYVLALTDDAP